MLHVSISATSGQATIYNGILGRRRVAFVKTNEGGVMERWSAPEFSCSAEPSMQKSKEGDVFAFAMLVIGVHTRQRSKLSTVPVLSPFQGQTLNVQCTRMP